MLSIDRLMQLPVERPEGHEFLSRPALQGAIEFRDVTFSYPGETGAALTQVSFRIAPGERVALIGRIGSGKTTIEKLVLGLYEPTSGSILIDGVESRQWDPAELRRGIGYVPQDIVLFYGTVRDNIVLGAPRRGRCGRAARRASRPVSPSSSIAIRKGFAMQVGERGEGLSGGQRQAIAIARAYLSQPPLLLLDEPSNAMDNRSEEHFKAHLARRAPRAHAGADHASCVAAVAGRSGDRARGGPRRGRRAARPGARGAGRREDRCRISLIRRSPLLDGDGEYVTDASFAALQGARPQAHWILWGVARACRAARARCGPAWRRSMRSRSGRDR